MRKVTKQVQETTYIADDGTIFKSEHLCNRHEETIRIKAKHGSVWTVKYRRDQYSDCEVFSSEKLAERSISHVMPRDRGNYQICEVYIDARFWPNSLSIS